LKDRKNNEKLVESIDFASLLSSSEKQLLVEFLKFQKKYEEIKENSKISTENVLNKLNNEVLIPLSIFTNDLSSLEIICKYLKEVQNLKNIEIASLIGRDSKSVWQAYDSSKTKHPKPFVIIQSQYSIPVSILKNRNLSVLENIVFYLKQFHNLTYNEISKLIKRDERTIWTVWQNIIKKNKLR